jgi:hypothetical protein
MGRTPKGMVYFELLLEGDVRLDGILHGRPSWIQIAQPACRRRHR